jgi:four helix bundle protein
MSFGNATLAARLRRVAVSIPSNIAERHVRRTASYLNHLEIALGSEAELQTQLERACRVTLADRRHVLPLLANAAEVGRLLRGLFTAVAAARSDRDPR